MTANFLRRCWQAIPSGIVCLAVIFALFGYIASVMGTPNMLNTIMKTAHDLLLNTVFYLMGICVITGALGRLFVEFGVVNLLEKMLRPLMRHPAGSGFFGSRDDIPFRQPGHHFVVSGQALQQFFQKVSIYLLDQLWNRLRYGSVGHCFHDRTRFLS